MLSVFFSDMRHLTQDRHSLPASLAENETFGICSENFSVARPYTVFCTKKYFTYFLN